ncbi:hypothetical protein X755_06765 [Mesorhizobium sp. LNJC405B00]|nr:hypothetical protein X755_06765 [Mesorhizobium sp. LNJC405B00]
MKVGFWKFQRQRLKFRIRKCLHGSFAPHFER